ncbi:MAG TPA: hypothetical protein ENJ60_04245 [Aeromonadales bacterium]|nr:hypothetical protein [Aeromonadales bacterium]
MLLQTRINNTTYTVDLSSPRSIAIALDFDGQQPNHFGSPIASSAPLKIGNFIGDTLQGSSCNCEQITLVPHCVGTHTESIGHVLNSKNSLIDCLDDQLKAATLISVSPNSGIQSAEHYQPALTDMDQIITQKDLHQKLGTISQNKNNEFLHSLIIRTLPNVEDKRFLKYGTEYQPPFFSNDAMEFIFALGVEHLLVDLPSVDRMYDEGLLSNHRIFWNIEPEGQTEKNHYHQHKTITEMVFVPQQIKDGHYLLDIQHPRWKTDAIPSNPILYPLTEIN